DREVSGPRQEDRQRERCSQAVLVPQTASDRREGQVSDFIVLDLFACEGGATAGYTEAGATVYAVDLDKNRLARNPAKHKLVADALEVLRRLTRGEAIIFDSGYALTAALVDLAHKSPPCQGYTRGSAGS